MVGPGQPGARRRPAHATRRGFSKQTEKRLADIGRQLPPPSPEDQRLMAADRAARFRRRLAFVLPILLVVVLGIGAAVQAVRPVPPPTIDGATTSMRIPGVMPALPWPGSGEAALAVQGAGTIGEVHDDASPIAGLAGILTSYVILKDHPLSTGGATGPSIGVTPQVLAAFQAGSAAGDPEVTVNAGESLTELDALEGLLIDSGDDIATLLADWDAGSTSAFVAKMQLTALELGLKQTRITDPSGSDPGTVSTPSDLIRLGEAAMKIPVFSQIVSLGQATLPVSGLAYNPNFDLGEDGIIGIMAASNAAGNGCYLFAAQKTVQGQTVTLYGAVFGQSGPNGPNTAAVNAGDALVKAALASITVLPVVTAGHVAGRLVGAWGASAPVVASGSVNVIGWPGLRVSVVARPAKLTVPVAAGTSVGVVQVRQGTHVSTAVLKSTGILAAPSPWWRLTR
jgi:serine-type D-Ala-D-Ala carboxypeptidase (penicillin-binding protein 5/6)